MNKAEGLPPESAAFFKDAYKNTREFVTFIQEIFYQQQKNQFLVLR